MKKLCWVFIIALTSQNAISQKKDLETDQSRSKELFFGASSLTFALPSLTYKKQQKNNSRYFKLSISNIHLNSKNWEIDTTLNINSPDLFDIGASISVGIEKRKSINDKIAFFYGPNLNLRYELDKSIQYDQASLELDQKNVKSKYSIAIPYTLGMLYFINNRFSLSLEVNPFLSSSFQTDKRTYNSQNGLTTGSSNNLDFGLNINNTGRFSLAIIL